MPSSDSWQGNWFPHVPGGADDPAALELTSTVKPSSVDNSIIEMDRKNQPKMGIANGACDDAQTRLAVDFDAKNASHQLWYHCLSPNRTAYLPQLNVAPLMTEHTIPPMYEALHRCVNETIQYDDRLPTL